MTATEAPIFTAWDQRDAQLWQTQPVRLAHRLHELPLFSRAGLAALIERYPSQHYNLVHMGPAGQRRFWREGEIGNLSGAEVLTAIEQGRIWINLRNVAKIDPAYRDLLKQIFVELQQRMPGFSTFNEGIGILISSPNAQVYYHADLPGQALWQIAGRKRLYLYPNTQPFLAPEHLEGIALFGHEMDVPYEPWYDEYAKVVELQPGQMMHWPLNAPHRIENLDCLNVSMTMEYWTDDIRRRHIVNVANGILREGFGIAPRSRATAGPAFLAKKVMQKALRNRDWSPKDKPKRGRPPVDFRLDPARLGQIVDLKPAGA
ncbi:cupin-like domain-containing protein [Methylobacterium symbioticum]|uniref:JmjC domain-containing protein n=1 Tax=Methylobacterium symbioticum TaxID=2584084 RepID=A0A509E9M4_9HYPH|nr:cupin-like domain-containing protein [Methylobacterium symbioticum]VUD70235.1 hypothetical protein MET9862_00799 [Methylobacterium symbioticum]